jgi:hypothetical protein
LIKRPRAAGQVITADGRRPGPYAFLPSEAFLNTNPDDEKIDVYCLAMTLWVLSTGEAVPPRHPIQPGGHYSLGKRRQEQRHIGELDEILAKATDADPTTRPNMAQFAAALQHWLTGLDTSSGYAAELAALERNMRQVLRWLVEYATTVECAFGNNILSADRNELPKPPGLTWPEISAALARLHEQGLAEGKPGDGPAEDDGSPGWWLNVYPSPLGVEKVLDKAVLIARLAPLLRSLPRQAREGLKLSMSDAAPDGFDDWKLPPPEYVFLAKQAQAYGLADFDESLTSGYIWLSNLQLTTRGLEFLAALEHSEES